jgi:hypothetical protein
VNSKGAAHAIIISALLMGGIYAWLWLSGGSSLQTATKLTAGKLVGYGPQVSPEGFLVAWSIVYGGLAVASTIIPGLAGALAVLLLLTGMIANFGSASETALALVKSKTGTTHAGPEAEPGMELVQGGEVPAGASNALEGYTGGIVPLAKAGEHAPTKLPPAPSQIKVAAPINYARLKTLTRAGYFLGKEGEKALKMILKHEITLREVEDTNPIARAAAR